MKNKKIIIVSTPIIKTDFLEKIFLEGNKCNHAFYIVPLKEKNKKENKMLSGNWVKK